MKITKQRIYEIIEVDREDDKWSSVYDVFMLIVIALSIIPMALKNPAEYWVYIDRFCVAVFIIDYLLRFWTADLKFPESKHPYRDYPFSFLAVVDFLSILPSLTRLTNALKAFRLVRILKLMRLFQALRVFKAFRYSKNFDLILRVIKRMKGSLLTVTLLTITYIFTSALIVFNVEPDTFKDFFEALYWATISLATIGYGDITPVTGIGRFVAMISSILGLAIIALPSGILTAGFLEELDKERRVEEAKKRKQDSMFE